MLLLIDLNIATLNVNVGLLLIDKWQDLEPQTARGIHFSLQVKLYEDDRYSAVSLAHGEGWSLLAEACASFKLLT